ncbi:hypothetical protein BO70DRAFT_123205 [Aspergillus heteromorphus CBS 117.55]|uniref:Uncharacterized protein n=1 Tax=Aspergillus heteromorphus CBS 117.55 TaxID=1448321 RepID=A0A317VDX9_9EURO|nr:uncharacterized protein BO70DRAFT_123205 [Aspergillus heteromorphus CBS 117.55]PWY71471.1 hypothetical protein BO70DRAFT_123205 [Aspergillus heteromorphus CBS 117.55]
MSAPLSPLPSSRQNSQALSPDYANPTTMDADEIDMDAYLAAADAQENILSSPLKVVAEVAVQEDPSPDDAYEGHDQLVEHENGNENDDYASSPQVAPSSPFRIDARDETVDFQRLRALNRQASVGPSEHSATPRKRSYEHAPDDLDDEDGPADRHKKGTGPRGVPEITVYDEDCEIAGEQRASEGAGPEVVNSMMEEKHNEGMSTVLHENDNGGMQEEQEVLDLHDLHEDDVMIEDPNESMDETCLSTFSAIPDMTTFAQLRSDSPFKVKRPLPSNPARPEDSLRQSVEPATPTTARKSPRKSTLLSEFGTPMASPTPRRREVRDSNETPNLLDLTDQPNLFPRHRYSVQNERYSPSRRSPLRAARDPARSPGKVSLLDFDIPSAPTPRSIPTVTPRELESLKSGFLSEISSLKATLSGKEAEVASLKQAVADAERRVGEALEEVRNEIARVESLEIEQAEWQRRGQEMEAVLRNVRAEIVDGEQEKDRLVKKVDEVEKAKEQLEGKVVELESQLAAALQSASTASVPSGSTIHTKSPEETAKEVQDAVEKVARELHTLYKGKHETKVAALKKSYEARWEKRLREAENKLATANEENERLRTERDATVPEAPRIDTSLISQERDEHEAEKRVLEAQIKGLQQEMAALKNDSENLRTELKQERAEKGDLVAAVDEWLSIQQNQPPAPSASQSSPDQEIESPEPVPAATEASSENFQRSVSHSSTSSGIRPPSTTSAPGEKKISKIRAPGQHLRGTSGGKSGIAVFGPGRSGIMGSIERMGRGGA